MTPSENLAANLRALRERRGLTQHSFAKACGIPRTTLSGLESGMGNPTLGVLTRVADTLGASLEELLSAPRTEVEYFPAAKLPVQRRGPKGLAKVVKLLPYPVPGMEIDRMELPKGGRVPGVPHRPGTFEYLYCEQGQIQLWVAGTEIALRQGDVAAFPGDQRHSYHQTGAETAVGFSVVHLAPLGRPPAPR
ncbi:MAG: helix-turn-helix transcriptional regulator [Myxococcales bacterium]|nr:helix-turn-helix transcriptional regulator [Myxococcales bacterium]